MPKINVDLKLVDVEGTLPRREEFEKITFASKSEVACALLMERYIQGWRCVDGATYQVPLGFGRKADFKIDDTLFEYHPIALSREMMSTEGYKNLQRTLKHVKGWIRDEVESSIKDELYYQYAARRQILANHAFGEGTEMIVATDPKGFWRKILQRFSAEPPGLKQFHREWDDIFGRLR